MVPNMRFEPLVELDQHKESPEKTHHKKEEPKAAKPTEAEHHAEKKQKHEAKHAEKKPETPKAEHHAKKSEEHHEAKKAAEQTTANETPMYVRPYLEDPIFLQPEDAKKAAG